MEIILETPSISSLSAVTAILASWQEDACANHLHPGDLGWFERFGAEKAASSIRVWSSATEDKILAIGLLDGNDLLRVTIAPSARDNEALAHAMATDITNPARGILPPGNVYLDIPAYALARKYIAAMEDWAEADEWTWLRVDLSDAPQPSESLDNFHVEIVRSPDQIRQRVEMQTLAFRKSTFTTEQWHAMAASPAYGMGARCILLYQGDEPVGSATAWSAGLGKQGMLEAVGVSAKHQGRGLGTALCRAAIAELRHMGASSAVVSTPSANCAALGVYKKVGFVVTSLQRDLCRDQ